jgi:hypothetical protein
VVVRCLVVSGRRLGVNSKMHRGRVWWLGVGCLETKWLGVVGVEAARSVVLRDEGVRDLGSVTVMGHWLWDRDTWLPVDGH